MAPVTDMVWQGLENRFAEPSSRTSPPTRESLTKEGGFLEAWAQGYNVGSLIILILIVFCNYRSGILLHKLILLELVLALWHGTFIFADDPAYGWYLSATATLLFISYQLHNVVSWLKIRPFLPPWGSKVFIFSLCAVQPFWIVEAWSNFAYFNQLDQGNDINERMRPFEALLRDPWWIFTTWKLIDSIKKTYGYKLWALVRINTRFGVMLACMFISIAFLLTDVGVNAARITSSSGINPYWRFALVFKCASDTIFLDDFKSVLDDIIARKLSSAGGTVHRGSIAPNHRPFTSKSSHSSSGIRSDDFITMADYGSPNANGAMTSIECPRPAAKSKYPSSLISRGRNPEARSDVPKIHVQHETSVVHEPRDPSHESWRSDTQMIQNRPEHPIYGSRKENSSSGMLSVHGGSNG